VDRDVSLLESIVSIRSSVGALSPSSSVSTIFPHKKRAAARRTRKQSRSANASALARSQSAPSKEVLLWGHTTPAAPWLCRWPEPSQPLVNQKHAHLPRTVPEILRYGNRRGGPQGDQNMERLNKAFPLRIRIEAAENRSVTAQQMASVFEFAENKCHEWSMEPASLTTYQIQEWIIQPATKLHCTAFAEHLLEEEQPAGWFITHWWGEPIAALLQCVKTHLDTRGLSSKTPYWLCEFANCPHDPSDYILEHPKQSNVYKAMRCARCKVLLVMDAATPTSGPGTPFKRLWCGFEISLCLDRSGAVLDVATSDGRETQLITDGLTHKEKTVEQYQPGDGTRMKVKREKPMPAAIVQAALDFSLQSSRTSDSADQQAILNAIVGRKFDAQVLERHPRYDEVNRKMRKLFALIFYRTVSASEAPKSEHGRLAFLGLQRAMSAVLCQDVPCTSLSLSLAGANLQDKEVQALIKRSFPPGLSELTLDLRCTDASDQTLTEILASLPPSLTRLTLEVASCSSISDDGIKDVVCQLPESVTSLCLSAAKTKVSPLMVHQVKDLKAIPKKSLKKRSSMQPDMREVDEVTALEQLLNSRMTFELRKGIVEKLRSLGREALC